MRRTRRTQQRRQAAGAEELRPLSGTIWQVIDIEPTPNQAYKSIISNFRPDGIVVTTKTNMDGRSNQNLSSTGLWAQRSSSTNPDMFENTKFKIEGDKLFIDYGNGSATLQRIS